MKLRYVLIPIVCMLITSCAGFQKPTSYVHFPEYGYLPLIEDDHYKSIMITYVAYDWQEASDFSKGDNIGNIGFSERNYLPKSRQEAMSIVEKNFSVDKELRMRDLPKDILTTTLAAPLALLYWAPGIAIISEYYAHKPESDHDKQGKETLDAADVNYYQKTPVINRKNTNNRFTTDVSFLITDEQNKSIPNVKTLLLTTPIPFEAYADEKGCRTFPKKSTHLYHLPEKFAEILAESLGNEGAPHGKATDINGLVRYNIQYDEKQEDLSVYILIRGKGYQSKFVKLPFSEMLKKNGSLRIVLKSAEEETPNNSGNPWMIAKKLEQQVLYYTKKYEGYAPRVLADYPSISWNEYEDLVLAATKAVPDYPLVSAAMFYYEAERGRPEEAKKHHRYIQDDIYVKVVYGLNWEKGIRLK